MNYCLLVEDDPEDQEFFIDTLEEVCAHAGCYAVSNGHEALTILTGGDFLPDVIFTDINMPCMNGFEFLQHLQRIETLRHIPVIVYSSDYNEGTIKKAKALGAAAFYSKTRMNTLREILRKYFKGE